MSKELFIKLGQVKRMLIVSLQIRRGAVVGYFLGAILEIAAFITAIYASARVTAILANFISTGNSDGIWFWLWVDIIAGILMGLAFFIMQFGRNLLYYSVVMWSTREFHLTLSHIDIGDFYNPEVRDKIHKVEGGYTWRIAELANSNLEFIYGVLRFLAITAIVSQITWWMVPVIALFLIPSLISETKLSKVQWFVWDSKNDDRHIFWGLDWIIKQVKGQMEIRALQAREFVLGKITELNKNFYAEQEALLKKANKSVIPSKIFESVGTAIGAIYLLSKVLSRSISLDNYFFLSGALLRVGAALNNIFGVAARMQDNLSFSGYFFELLDIKPKIVDKKNAIELDQHQALTIEFRDIDFTYPGQHQNVFKNFNLKINPGEHLAIVGENGAGKTTLIKLLLRFYKPDKGNILINGIDLNDIKIESWYRHVASLFQEFNRYPLTIRENIAIGGGSNFIDNKKVNKAARDSSVDQSVKKYELGLDTVLDSSFKNGVEPSGGQWQRVGIARAFYRDAQIIILDEPTSAIDAKAEYDIFNNIFDNYAEHTVLIVSHRFSTVRRADRIIVISEGEIIENGSHQALLKKNGHYHEMFTKQAEGYR